MGILSFTFIGVYLSLNFLKISTLADSISKNELGLFLFSRPKGVHRSLLAPTWGDICDAAGTCGTYSICDISNSMPCNCLNGFKPKAAEKWNNGECSDGCYRTEALNCQNKDDGFVKYAGVKLPDTIDSLVNHSMSPNECKENCFSNCSCIAYASSNVNGGGVCTIWFGELVNMRMLSDGGQDLYIRVPASELKANRWPKAKIAVIVVSVVFGMLLVAYCIHRNRTKFKEKARKNGIISQNNGKNEDIELPIFSLSTIVTATDNFSWNMKLGEGGFGPVYKGNLVDGREIAVKRLSRSSGQGTIEFKNEVLLIAKLQHRNLIKLEGDCWIGLDASKLSVGSPGVFFIYIKIPD